VGLDFCVELAGNSGATFDANAHQRLAMGLFDKRRR